MKSWVSLLVINIFLYAQCLCATTLSPDTIEALSVDVDLVRSISGQTPRAITYAAAAFGGTDRFYLGANNISNKQLADVPFALSRGSLERDKNAVWTAKLNALAPAADVTINGTEKKPSPLGVVFPITQVALLDGTYPVATAPIKILQDESGTAKAQVVLVSDIVAGKTVSTDGTDAIKDANDALLATTGTVQPAQQFAALEASNDTIFLAVPQGRGGLGTKQPKFGDKHSGIVRMQPDANDNKKLRIVKLDGTNVGTDKAYEICVSGGTQKPANAFPAVAAATYVPQPNFTFFAAYDGANDPAVKIGEQIDMHWDPVLERLYIGLTGATGGAAKAAAIQSLLIGRLDYSGTSTWGKLFVEPALDIAKSFNSTPGSGLLGTGEDASTDSIIGFNRGNATERVADTYKVRTMHTSTGKAYVIVNGDVRLNNADNNKTLVCALPLATQDPNPNYNGFIADNLFQDSSAKKIANTKRVDPATSTRLEHVEANVGAGLSDFHFIKGDATLPITDMQAIGDAVYVSVGEGRAADLSVEDGIFSSAAIFNEKGAVRAWTPWQRVGGMQNISGNDPIFDSVARFGIDEHSQNVWFLDGDDNATLRVSQWNAGDALAHPGGTLSAALSELTNNGGVTNLIAFDGATPGFKPATTDNTHPHDYFSMMVATGYGRVALIQTGQDNGDGIFRPIRDFTSAVVGQNTTVGSNPTVYIFSSADDKKSLPDLGRVIAAEVARQPVAKTGGPFTGWLFVGGEKGLAVLRDIVTGRGWETSTTENETGLVNLKGATNADYPGGSNFAWTQLKGENGEDFKDVRKIVADGKAGFVYVLTRTKLIRIKPSEDDFKEGSEDFGVIANANLKIMFDLENGKVADQVLTGGYLPVGTNDSSSTDYATTKRAFSLEAGVDEFFDMAVLFSFFASSAPQQTKLALATTQGVVITNIFSHNFTGLAPSLTPTNVFLKVPRAATGGDLLLGPAVRFDAVNTLRGGELYKVNNNNNVFAFEGNVYVTAYDKDLTHLGVYRFNSYFADNEVQFFPLNEPYKDASGAQTPYFYKIGDIAPAARRYLNPQGPADFIGTVDEFGSLDDGFLAAIPMMPNISAYQKLAPPLSAEEVSLGRVFDGDVTLNAMTIDPASGAKYIFGEFGVLVNE